MSARRVESTDGLFANWDEDGSSSTDVVVVDESQPLTPQWQKTLPVAKRRKLARFNSDATDTCECEDSWRGRDLNDLADNVQDNRGETVRCTMHDIRVKVASFYVNGSLQKTVMTVPLPSNVLITEHQAANDTETGADKWLDLSLIGIAPASPSPSAAMSQLFAPSTASPSAGMSQLVAPATAPPSAATSQLALSQLDQSSSSVAMSKLRKLCRLERMIRNKTIGVINKEYKSVKSKAKTESRKKRLAKCGKFFWNHIKFQAMRSFFPSPIDI